MLAFSLKTVKRQLRYWGKGFSFVLSNQPQGMLNSHVGVRFLLSMAPLGSPSPLGIITQPHNGGESLLIGTPMLSSSFRPSIVVIIGVLITMFSLTFFLLLYVKRCKQFILVGEGEEIPQEPSATPPFPRTYSSIDRLLIEAFPMLSFASLPISNSGVDRLLVEALPMFTFASLQGIKEGLECAVCLCQFEDNDILRLLPKCQHAFHVDCVDLWLASHSTCPLCRHCVSQEDLILVEKSVSSRHSLEALQQELAPIVAPPPLNSALLGTLSSKEMEAPIQVIVPSENPDAAVVVPSKPETTTRRDGLLLDDPLVDHITDSAKTFVPCRRFAHRIVISDVFMRERWSDFAAKDVLFLNTQLLFGLNDRLSVSRISSCSRKSFLSPLNLQTISPCRPDFILTDGRRFSCSSANRKEVLSSPSRAGKDFGQMNVNVQSSGVAKNLFPRTPRDATTMASMGATMALEPSHQWTSRLPGITDRPPLPPGGKPKHDFEGKGAQFFNRAFSLGRMSSLDLDERLHMGSGQTSLSVVGTTVEQIAPSGGRKDFVGSKPPEAPQTVISEKTRKWLSIARKTLNQLLGHEKRIVPSSNVVIGPKI